MASQGPLDKQKRNENLQTTSQTSNSEGDTNLSTQNTNPNNRNSSGPISSLVNGRNTPSVDGFSPGQSRIETGLQTNPSPVTFVTQGASKKKPRKGPTQRESQQNYATANGPNSSYSKQGKENERRGSTSTNEYANSRGMTAGRKDVKSSENGGGGVSNKSRSYEDVSASGADRTQNSSLDSNDSQSTLTSSNSFNSSITANSLQGSSRGSVSSSKSFSSPKKSHNHHGNQNKSHYPMQHSNNRGYQGHNEGHNAHHYYVNKNPMNRNNKARGRGVGAQSALNYGAPYQNQNARYNRAGNRNGGNMQGPSGGGTGGNAFPGQRNGDNSSKGYQRSKTQNNSMHHQSRDDHQGYEMNNVNNDRYARSPVDLLAVLRPPQLASEGSSICTVPSLPTQQAASVVASNEDTTHVANQSTTTTYFSRSPNGTNSSSVAPSPSQTPSLSPDQKGLNSNEMGSTQDQDQMMSCVVNHSFQVSQAQMTTARPDVSSESVPFFATNSFAHPTVRDVNNNPPNGKKSTRAEGNNERNYSNMSNSLNQNSSNYSSKKKNRNQQNSGNRNNYSDVNKSFAGNGNRGYNNGNGTATSNSQSMNPGAQFPYAGTNLTAAKTVMNNMVRHPLLGTFSAADVVRSDMQLMTELVNNNFISPINSMPLQINLIRALNETMALQTNSLQGLQRESAAVNAANKGNNPAMSSGNNSMMNGVMTSASSSMSSMDQPRVSSASPVVSAPTSVPPSVAALIGSNLTPVVPVTTPVAAQMGQMGLLNMFSPNVLNSNPGFQVPSCASGQASPAMSPIQQQNQQIGTISAQQLEAHLNPTFGQLFRSNTLQMVNNQLYQQHLNNSNLSDAASLFQFFPVNKVFQNMSNALNNSRLANQWPTPVTSSPTPAATSYYGSNDNNTGTNMQHHHHTMQDYNNGVHQGYNSRNSQAQQGAHNSHGGHEMKQEAHNKGTSKYNQSSRHESEKRDARARNLYESMSEISDRNKSMTPASQSQQSTLNTSDDNSNRRRFAKRDMQMQIQPSYGKNTISSQFQYQKRCKKDTFCVVIPDEVGTSAYYCTNVLYEIPIQIWNPTVWKMEIATKIRNSTNTRHLMPFAEYPFQTEGSFLLGSNETTKLKVFFKSQYPADYVAELVVEAKSLRNNMDTRQESFVKSVKISANADDMHIVPFRMLPSGTYSEIPHNQLNLLPMKPGTSQLTEVIVQNRSRVTANVYMVINQQQQSGPSVGVSKFNELQLERPLSKLSYNTHGYVDLGANGINYDQFTLTLKTKVPLYCKDTKAKVKLTIYAISQRDQHFLCNLDVNIQVEQPKLHLYTQQIEMHEEVLDWSLPVRNCSPRYHYVTFNCNSPAFAVNPVEMDIPPYMTVPVTITYDQGDTREQASVVITVEPEGPVYTVNVDGRPRSKRFLGLSGAGDNYSLGDRSTHPIHKTTSLPAVLPSMGYEEETKAGYRDHMNDSNDSGVLFDLTTKVILANVEYLLFPPNGKNSPVKKMCILKNNSSHDAILRLSIVEKRFTIVAVHKNESLHPEKSGDTFELGPQDVLKIIVTFFDSQKGPQKQLDLIRGQLSVKTVFKETSLLNSSSAIGLTTSSFGDTINHHRSPFGELVANNHSQFNRLMVASQDYTVSTHFVSDDEDSDSLKLPLIGYSGSSSINVTLKREANVDSCWNLAATVSVQNTGDRFAYVAVTSQHAIEASPRCFSLRPKDDVQIGKLILKPGVNGNIVEITWGDAIIKQLYEKFCHTKCVYASKQVHQFLVAPYPATDSQNQNNHLPSKEDMPHLDPSDLIGNIYTTEVKIGPEVTNPKNLKMGSVVMRDISIKGESPYSDMAMHPMSFDKPTDADFPLLVSTPPEPTKVAIGMAKQIKPKCDPINFTIDARNIVMELSNTSFNYKMRNFCKIVGSFTVANSHTEFPLECEMTCQDESVLIQPTVFLVEPKASQKVFVQAYIHNRQLPDLNIYGDNSSLDSKKWNEIRAAMKFDDRKDGKIRSPYDEAINLYLPGSFYNQKLATHLEKPEDVHNLVDSEDSNVSVPLWQLTLSDSRFGDCSELFVKFKNCYGERVKWTLKSLFTCVMTVALNRTSMHSPSKALSAEAQERSSTKLGLYRVKYPVFRLEKTSGFLNEGETAVIRCEFWPIEIGKYSQHFELKLVSRWKGEEELKKTHRLILKGAGTNLSRGKMLKDASPKKRLERIEFVSDLPKETREKFLVTIDETGEKISYEPTVVGTQVRKFVYIKNADGKKQHNVCFLNPEPPFVVNHESYVIGARRILKVPIIFKPTEPGTFSCFFLVITDTTLKMVLPVILHGTAVDKPKQLKFASEPLALSTEQLVAASPKFEREENSAKSEESIVIPEHSSLSITVSEPISARRVNSGSKKSSPSSVLSVMADSDITEIVSECASVSVVETQYETAAVSAVPVSSEDSIVDIANPDAAS